MRVTGDPGEGEGGLFRGYCDGKVRKIWLAPFGKVHCNKGFFFGGGVFNKSGKILQWISCCRGNVIPVSNVCEAALTSLFWALNGLYELPEVHFLSI